MKEINLTIFLFLSKKCSNKEHLISEISEITGLTKDK